MALDRKTTKGELLAPWEGVTDVLILGFERGRQLYTSPKSIP